MAGSEGTVGHFKAQLSRGTRHAQGYSTDAATRHSTTDSTENCLRMSRARAPTAIRMPISRVRSVNGHHHDIHDADSANDERDQRTTAEGCHTRLVEPGSQRSRSVSILKSSGAPADSMPSRRSSVIWRMAAGISWGLAAEPNVSSRQAGQLGHVSA